MATRMIHRVAVQSPMLARKDKYDSPYSLGEGGKCGKKVILQLSTFEISLNKPNLGRKSEQIHIPQVSEFQMLSIEKSKGTN